MSLPGVGTDPGKGDVGGIRALAQIFTSRSSDLDTREGEASAAVAALAETTSTASGVLGARATLLQQRFGEGSSGSADAARILGTYASALETIQLLARIRKQAASDAYDTIWARRREALNATSEVVVGWALQWDDVLPAWMYASDQSYLHRWQGAIDDYRDAAHLYNALQADRDEIDRAAARDLRGIDLVEAVARGGAIGVAGLTAGASVWAGDLAGLSASSIASLGDPDVIREVWNSLDPDRRDELIAASPLVIGNLNGIPLRDRVAANRLNIQAEITRREREVAALEGQIADLEGRIDDGTNAARIDALRTLIDDHQTYIESYQDLLTKKWNVIDESRRTVAQTGVNVVVFDPDNGAIGSYYGPIDPDTGDIPAWVQHVAVSVPGTGANMASFSEDRAQKLYNAAGYDSAVFQWAGGAFPQTIPEATQASYSEKLAPTLAAFVNAVDVPGTATMTVLGHSYGGATVGLAEQAGLRADRVLYVSAAGMGRGVEGLADFPNTAGVPHYAMMARNDTVVGLIQGDNGDWNAFHGQSPLYADGVTRLETGFVDADDHSAGDIEGTGMFESHSAVYRPDSTAFDNMVAVITGGEAELYAEDEVVTNYAGGQPIVIDGIDRSDYAPRYIEVQ